MCLEYMTVLSRVLSWLETVKLTMYPMTAEPLEVCAICRGLTWDASSFALDPLYGIPLSRERTPASKGNHNSEDYLHLDGHTHTLSLSLSLSLTHTLTHSHTHTLTHSHTHTLTHSHTHTLTHSHTHTHTLTHSHTHTLTHSHTHTLTHSHTHTLTHSHTHSHKSRTPPHGYRYWKSQMMYGLFCSRRQRKRLR